MNTYDPCVITLVDGGGSCTVTDNNYSSPHFVGADYQGDSTYPVEHGAILEIAGYWGRSALSVSTPSASVTGPASYHVTVKGDNNYILPGGKVAVADGKGGVCTIQLAGGSGHCSIVERASASPYLVTATYVGDANYVPSTARVPLVVTKSTPRVRASAANPAPAGPVAYSVGVMGAPMVVATGSVAVSDGEGRSCKAVLNLSGRGVCSIREYPGTYDVTFRYPGDSNYDPATAVLIEKVA